MNALSAQDTNVVRKTLRLIRISRLTNGTIARDANMCDFRWHALNAPEEKGSSETLSDKSEQRKEGKHVRNSIKLKVRDEP